jgi:hypothetical protein
MGLFALPALQKLKFVGIAKSAKVFLNSKRIKRALQAKSHDVEVVSPAEVVKSLSPIKHESILKKPALCHL